MLSAPVPPSRLLSPSLPVSVLASSLPVPEKLPTVYAGPFRFRVVVCETGAQLGIGAEFAGELIVVVEVTDEGPGVDSELGSRVFERTVSGHNSTGLGLAVARDLAEADGGRLELLQHHPPVFALFLSRESVGRGGTGEDAANVWDRGVPSSFAKTPFIQDERSLHARFMPMPVT